ncbi:MAG: chromosomal replication initiator protein DnaA [Clostridia bacterium]|nr:chromosomal replication initiator protein DnaA [Clostridia bacterium]
MLLDKNELLNQAKELLKNEMTNISYATWIKTLEIGNIYDNKIELITTNAMQTDAIKSRYCDLIVNTFNFLTNKSWQLEIIDSSDSSNITSTQEALDNSFDSLTSSPEYSKTSLNPKYTFDTFVVGNNNRFAHAAALAVSEAPSSMYNPLFIYGGVGLGKTHLMQAIGNEILKRDSSKKVLYVTSEAFTNELVNAIKDANYKNELFRNKYRNIDILLIDDIQFFAGKNTAQEEFFHTFNTLHQNGKQIILSSDKPPRDIALLEDRLKSRFEWGLIADISMPDYEMRLAILRKKTQMEGILIDDDILSLIATKIDSNIRELEGVLNKILAYTSLTHSPITIEVVEKAINDVTLQKENIISADYIQDVVANYFKIDKKDMVSAKKSNDIAYPRQIAMYLCRTVGQMSFPRIGNDFGGRDHTTVMHAFKKIEKEIKENTNTKLIVESVKTIITNKK